MLTGYYPIDNNFINQIRWAVFEGIIRRQVITIERVASLLSPPDCGER
jgi:hypothetical protein